MKEIILETHNLTKQYGSITAVNQLSLKIPRGTIYGILGPNGSGKTTTLGMVLSTIHATDGTYRWFGEDDKSEVLKRIGAILEGPLFYPYMSGEDNLKIVARIKEVDYNRIPEVLHQVNLFDRKDYAFKTYSLGMKQRLAIAAALLADPEVLILDEPTNGLDPQGIAEMRNLIREIGHGDRTILLASHLLDEVERVCDHVAVLKKGTLLYSGEVTGLTQTEPIVELAAADLVGLERALREMAGIGHVTVGDSVLMAGFGSQPDVAAINSALHNRGISLTHLVLRQPRLEEQFLELIANSNS